ncbi:MAG TPA: winged helix-turn-helix domain-containing protein [Candidatus Eisenbacteria bacterium]|jgi:DNA-binding winged helix-turn-helix (wHTH) protein|nr:winged helix-turn-helix domain-containing protein [Candidatus Eisenbacteria bacterium]
MGSADFSSTLEPETAPRAGAGAAYQLASRYIRFGPFQVDQHRQEVTKSGSRLKLQGKVYQVLLALIEKQGEVVTREELRMRLWPADTHVNYDANVNTTVNKLRQALGDSSDQPLYIETVPRRGYCLVVQPECSDLPAVSVAVAPAAVAVEPSRTSDATTGKRKSDVWITVGVVALIIAGMLLGAAITRLWISHFAPGPLGF